MCGRIAFTTSIQTVAATFRAATDIDYPKRYNIAPSQMVPVVTAKDGKHREISLMKWGLVPHWAKDPSIGNRMINARAETLAEKPSFKTAYQKQRCIVPASGFYEWKAEAAIKQPYYIHASSKGVLLAIAGLWESWEGQDRLIESFTIITSQANEFMMPIHDRMPVIILPEYFEQWLNCRDYPGQNVAHLLNALPKDMLDAYPVSRAVNDPANDSWKCTQPA